MSVGLTKKETEVVCDEGSIREDGRELVVWASGR